MKTKFLISLILPFVPLFYVGSQWTNIPKIVPVHFDSNMNPNRFGAKSELLWIAITLSCVSILLTLLFKYLPKIDTKKNLENQKGFLESISLGTSIFMAILSYFIIQSCIAGGKSSIVIYLPMLFLFFMAFLGNYLINIKRNHFIGIRVSWTMKSESVWKKTHQFAGKLIFYGSLVGIAILFFLPDFKLKMIFTLVLLLVILTISTFKSYKIYKAESVI